MKKHTRTTKNSLQETRRSVKMSQQYSTLLKEDFGYYDSAEAREFFHKLQEAENERYLNDRPKEHMGTRKHENIYVNGVNLFGKKETKEEK